MDINNGVILGGATGYKPERVEIFLKSLNLAHAERILGFALYRHGEIQLRSGHS